MSDLDFVRKSVLWVDDQISFYENIIGNLSINGFMVYPYSDPESCLEELNSLVIDIYIIDYSMDNLNGLDLIREILSINSEANIIFLTNFGKDLARMLPEDLKRIPVFSKSEVFSSREIQIPLANILKDKLNKNGEVNRYNREVLAKLQKIKKSIYHKKIFLKWNNIDSIILPLVSHFSKTILIIINILPLLVKFFEIQIEVFSIQNLLISGLGGLFIISAYIFYNKAIPEEIRNHKNAGVYLQKNLLLIMSNLDFKRVIDEYLDKYSLKDRSAFYSLYKHYYQLNIDKSKARIFITIFIFLGLIGAGLFPSIKFIQALIIYFNY